MLRYRLVLAAAVLLAGSTGLRAQDPIFSGPQVGEPLPPFKAKGVFGEEAEKEIDLLEQAAGKPVLLVFVHQRTRPAFGLTNAVMKFAATRADAGLTSGVIFLSDDPTETGEWMQRVKQHLPEGVTYAISPDGIEGPGAYGLNRNVTLTVIVGTKTAVTANLALVQPSLPTDGPRILKAIADVTGGGKVPNINDLAGGRDRNEAREMRPSEQNDPKLAQLLRAVINKQAGAEEVAQAAESVEQYVAENAAARRRLGEIASTVVNSGKLSNYGTDIAQQHLRRWAKEFAAPPNSRPAPAKETAPPEEQRP